MPVLSKLNRVQVFIRTPQLMAYVEEQKEPLNLRRIFSPEDRARDAMIRARIKQVFGRSHVSTESIRTLLSQLKKGKYRKGAFAEVAVKVLPESRTLGSRGVPGIIRVLRDGRFLTLEIDLTAANKEDLLSQVGEKISAYQPEQVRNQRQDKHHKSTEHIDMWDVYDRWKGGEKVYRIAKQFYRERTGSPAGFGTNTKECKAVQRKVVAARSMIENNPYPAQ